MEKLFTILSLIALSSCSKVQEPPTQAAYQVVLPGDPALRPTLIKPHKVKYEKTGGMMTYIMKEVNSNGRDILELAVYYNQDETGTPDLMYFDKETLGYVGRKLEMKDYTIDVKFLDGKFTGSLEPAEGSTYKPIIYNKDYPHNAFEPAVINYFIAALPLTDGYKASIPVFDLNNGSQMFWSNIEVLGKEIIEVEGTKYETWKVVSKGIKEKTIWVSSEFPYAIKMKTKGSFGTWKLSKVWQN